MATDEVLDPDRVAELRRAQASLNSPALIRQLVEMFQAHTPRKMARIREAVSARDAAALEQVAHTLKTNCAVLGAVRMAAVCHRIEDAAQRQAFDEAAAAVTEAEAQLPGVLAAVATLAE